MAVLSLEWDFLYWEEDIFILNRGPVLPISSQLLPSQALGQSYDHSACEATLKQTHQVTLDISRSPIESQWGSQKYPGSRLNKKTVFPRYGDSHVKDKTVGRLSYL